MNVFHSLHNSIAMADITYNSPMHICQKECCSAINFNGNATDQRLAAAHLTAHRPECDGWCLKMAMHKGCI